MSAKKTTTEQGLGWRHMQRREALLRKHQDGKPCDWCGRPMYRDRQRNWDYNPKSTNPQCGVLQADHSTISRSKALELGVPIPLPDRLLHGECNRQRGDGGNDHLATASRGAATHGTEGLSMPWPW